MKRVPLLPALAASLLALAYAALPAPAGSTAAPAEVDASSGPVGAWRPTVQDHIFRLEHELHAVEADLADLRRRVSALAAPIPPVLAETPDSAG